MHFLRVFVSVGFLLFTTLDVQTVEDIVDISVYIFDDIVRETPHIGCQHRYIYDAFQYQLVADQTVAQRIIDEFLMVVNDIVEVLYLAKLLQHLVLFLVQNLVREVINCVFYQLAHAVYQAFHRLQKRTREETFFDILYVFPAAVKLPFRELRLKQEAEYYLVFVKGFLAYNQVQRLAHLSL